VNFLGLDTTLFCCSASSGTGQNRHVSLDEVGQNAYRNIENPIIIAIKQLKIG
jgi:hypothetical protein